MAAVAAASVSVDARTSASQGGIADLASIICAAAQRLTSVAPGVRLRPAWLRAQEALVLEAATGQSGADAEEAASNALLRLLMEADLRDACEGSLPQGLDRCHDLRVEGMHLVQLAQAVDISQPTQALEVEDFVEESEVTGSGNNRRGASLPRQGTLCLKVCLTDGAGQVVCGIERRPVAALRYATPGTKMVLGGRPLLRRGYLMLEASNLEVLGIAIPNSMVASEARSANLPPGATRLAPVNSQAPLPLAAPTSSSAPVVAGRMPAPAQTPSMHMPMAPTPNSAACGSSIRGTTSPRPAPVDVPGMHVSHEQITETLSITSQSASSRPLPAPSSQISPSFAPVACTRATANSSGMAATSGGVNRPVAFRTSAVSDYLDPSASSAAKTIGRDSGCLLEATQRYYVFGAHDHGEGLQVQLCDGVGMCVALVEEPLAQQLFPGVPRSNWPLLAQSMHGFFQLRWDVHLGGGQLVVESFGESPALGIVEAKIRELHPASASLPTQALAESGLGTAADAGA